MAFLTVKEDSVKVEGGGDYVYKSGIYELTLEHCEIRNTKNGAVQANYLFDKCKSYGNNIIKIDGQPAFGYKIMEALAAIIGEDSLSDPEPTTVKFKTKTEELNCIPELNDVRVKVWIQFKYGMYNNKVQERVEVRRFYRVEDNASGSEVITGENIGTRYKKDAEVAEEIIYDDNVTPEVVDAWKKSNQSGGGAEAPKPVIKRSGFPTGAKK